MIRSWHRRIPFWDISWRFRHRRQPRGRAPDGDDHEDPVMGGSRPRSGSAVDSLLLAGVKFATLGSTMANTMILSRSLSLEAYGTYAQGVLVVALCADATVLGLVDAVNFFFNRDSRESVTREYVNAIENYCSRFVKNL